MNKEIDFLEGYSKVIKAVVPEQFFNEAEKIVASHRPERVLADFEVYNMAGLRPKDHGFLNGIHCKFSREEQREILTNKRAEYSDDPVALQQIDVYDGDTEYHDKMREFRDALISGNSTREKELDAWFKEHYPDIK